MAEELVVDTTVLQKANAPITARYHEASLFARRVRILEDIRDGRLIALFSSKLVAEYRKQIPKPRNDYVRAFFELIVRRTHAVENWARWSGRHREKARKCRYPREDDHVLRTAIRAHPTTIVTEESRMLASDRCIYRAFRVHIRSV